MKTVSPRGGASVTVCPLPPGFPRGATWNAENEIVFSMGAGALNRGGILYSVSARGGAPAIYQQPDTTRGEFGFQYPHFMPDGKTLVHITFTTDGGSSVSVMTEDGGRTDLVKGHTFSGYAFPVFAPSGHILYESDADVWGVPFDPSTMTMTGAPFTVAERGAIPSVSNDGTLVYSTLSEAGTQRLVWVDRGGRIQGTIGRPQSAIVAPAVSPDGRRVAVGGEEQGNLEIWIHESNRDIKTRLSSDSRYNANPTWSPDGDQLVFNSFQKGEIDIYYKPVDGRGTAQPLVDGPWTETGPYWSRGGRYVIYSVSDPETNTDLWYLPVEGERHPVLFLQTPYQELLPVTSPSGRYVAYQSNATGRWEIYVKPFPSGDGEWQVSGDGGIHPRWSGQGDEIFFVHENALMAVPVATNPDFQRRGPPQKLFAGEDAGVVLDPVQISGNFAYTLYDAAPDGRRFAAIQTVREGLRTMTVVQNWAKEFEARE